MFTPGKKKKDGDADPNKPAESNATPKVVRAKSFRRIRGLLGGESRRKRRAERLAAAQGADGKMKSSTGMANSDDDVGDDESTVFNVQVDENASVGTGLGSMRSGYSSSNRLSSLDNGGSLLPTMSNDSGQTAEGLSALLGGKRSYILKVVLLLMDPASRRFELLQLEFDSLKALVSDVLAQIPISVTEAALREQNYVGICGVDAKEMTSGQLLADFCVGNEVLVAMPSSISAKECVRLARPILSDEKVISMLKSSGIDASAWKLVKKSKKKTDASATAKSMPDSVQESSERSSDAAIVVESRARNAGARNWAEPDSANAKGLNFVVGFFVVIFLSVLLQVFHLYISTPISPGSVVPPKVWLNKCGLLRFVSYCDDAFLHVEKSGNVVGYDSKKQVAWEIEGAVCKSTDKSCIPGMQFTKDLKVIVGGKPIRFVNKMGFDTPLAPWPFEAEPKLKTWLKNQKVIKK